MTDTIHRPDDDGTPDDFAISDVTMFRLERMDSGRWWAAVYRGDERVSLFLNADCPIACTIAEDELGLRDDSDEWESQTSDFQKPESQPTRQPAEVFPPGEFLRDELETRGWSQADLAEIIGRSESTVSDIARGERSITADVAQDLAAAFGTSAELWMNLEAAYRNQGALRVLETMEGDEQEHTESYEALKAYLK